jgi:hypothetical protein
MATDRGAARGQALASVALPLLFRTRLSAGCLKSFGGRDLCSSSGHLWLEIVQFLNVIPRPAPSTSLWYLSDSTRLQATQADGVRLNSPSLSQDSIADLEARHAHEFVSDLAK